MLHWIWGKIQMMLPLWLILKLYRGKKSLPVVLETLSGNKYRLVLITTDYGLVICNNKYDPNRLSNLRHQQLTVQNMQDEILNEINSLTFDQREILRIGDENIAGLNEY